MLGFNLPTGCQDPQPCIVCTGDGTGQIAPGLDVTIAGVVPSSSYGYYDAACCDGVNGLHRLRHFWSVSGSDTLDWCGMSFPGSACVWYGRIQNVPCDDTCPFRWMSVVLYNTDECDPGIAGHTSCVAAILLTREMPGPGSSPTFLAWTLCKMSSSDQTCADVAACLAMAGADGLRSIGGTASVGCSNLYPPYTWMYYDTLNGVPATAPTYWSCAWDYATGALTLKTAACGCEPGYTPCCCDGSDESDEVRTIYATVSGVASAGSCAAGCGCYNGWTWRLPLTWSPDGCSEAKSVPCWPCGGSAEIDLTLDKAHKKITGTLGGVNFAADWDGRCSSIAGTVLRYASGTGDGCDYSNATITLATSGMASIDPVGPTSEGCQECPKPAHMYVTFSGLGTYTEGSLTVDLSFLNGTWALEPGSPCISGCDWWSIDISGFDGRVIGTYGSESVTVQSMGASNLISVSFDTPPTTPRYARVSASLRAIYPSIGTDSLMISVRGGLVPASWPIVCRATFMAAQSVVWGTQLVGLDVGGCSQVEVYNPSSHTTAATVDVEGGN